MPQSFADQLRSIPMSPNLGQSLERAHRCARDQSHRLVTLEHLLLALTEDAEAALILQSANVDLARLGTDVSGYLGRLLEDMRAEPGAEPRPDSELLPVRRSLTLGSTSPSPSRHPPSPSPWLRSPPTRSWRQRGHASRSAHPLRPRRIPQSCMTRRRPRLRSRPSRTLWLWTPTRRSKPSTRSRPNP